MPFSARADVDIVDYKLLYRVPVLYSTGYPGTTLLYIKIPFDLYIFPFLRRDTVGLLVLVLAACFKSSKYCHTVRYTA